MFVWFVISKVIIIDPYIIIYCFRSTAGGCLILEFETQKGKVPGCGLSFVYFGTEESVNLSKNLPIEEFIKWVDEAKAKQYKAYLNEIN